MRHINKIFILLLLGCIAFIAPTRAQVTPVDNQTAPSSTNAVIYSPPAPFNSSGNTAPTLFNYTKSWYPTSPVTSITNPDYPIPSIRVATAYTNGWGEQLQSIVRKGVSSSRDLVTFSDLRPSLTAIGYLSYPNQASTIYGISSFRMNPYLEQSTQLTSLYPTDGANGYNMTEINDVAGTRFTKTYAAGTSFSGTGNGTTNYTAIHNDIYDPIRIWEIEDDLPISYNQYSANQLSISITSAAHDAKVKEYANKSGQVVCKKVQSADNNNQVIWLTTYYVYDEFGKLRFIIPPKTPISNRPNTNIYTVGIQDVEKLCFTFKYDKYGQLIEKGTAGKEGKDFIVYDLDHRQVLYQSPLMRQMGKWQFTIYDRQNRPIITGLTTSSSSRIDWQSWLYGTTPSTSIPLLTVLLNGISGTYPSSIANCDIHEYNYYDNYDFDQSIGQPLTTRSFDATSFSGDYLTSGAAVVPAEYKYCKGQLTGKRVKVLDNTSAFANQWISSVLFYDQQGRNIQTHTLNPWNTTNWDISAIQYNFSGDPVLIISNHNAFTNATKSSTKVYKLYTYDESTGKLLTIQQKTDNEHDWRDITSNTFDQYTGNVKEKNLGGAERQKYTYNIRGQLTGINPLYVDNGTPYGGDMTFGIKMAYDYGFTQNRLDGTIAGITWRGAGASANKYSYGYSYDGTGKLIAADFREFTSSTWNKTNRDYSVSNVAYDYNGNILSMNQEALKPGTNQTIHMDQLTYSYYPNTNKIRDVSDAITSNYGLHDFIDGNSYNGTTPEYEYDDDGNLTKDLNKSVTITYNHQDLPLDIETFNGSTQGTVNNIYDASGTLLQKTITPAGGTPVVYRYWGPFVYKDYKMEYMLHEEGRCRWLQDSSKFRYDYFVKDHLGNVRTVVTADVGGTIDYVASHEIASSATEELIFDHIPPVRADDPDGGPGQVAELDGSIPEKRMGTTIVLSVMAGDKFNVKGSYYYDADEGNDNVNADPGSMLESILTALVAGVNPIGGDEGGSNVDIVNSLFSPENYVNTFDALKEGMTDPALPRSYINYMVFDHSMNLIPGQSGVLQAGSPGSWQTLELANDIIIEQNGYLAIYLSNEQYRTVYWDNLDISYYRGRLLEEQHYYPFGLTIREGQNSPVPNKFLYQGKKLQDEFGLELYDFHARQYDPQIGRFWGIDLLDQFPSGYTGMGNDPANMIDPSGMKTYYSGDGGSSAAKASLAAWDAEARHNADRDAVITDGGGAGGTLAGLSISQLLRIADATANGGRVDIDVLGGSGLGQMPSRFSIGNRGIGYWKDFSINGDFKWYGTVKSGVQLEGTVGAGSKWMNSKLSDGPGALDWDGPIFRGMTPDFASIGVGFSGIYILGSGSSIELQWVVHGPEKSFFPAVTVTQAVGVGYSIAATINIGSANYSGPANNIKRSMLETNTIKNGDMPGGWVSGGIAALAKVGVSGNISYLGDGYFIMGGQFNFGGGLPCGDIPINLAGGMSNTWILKDWGAVKE